MNTTEISLFTLLSIQSYIQVKVKYLLLLAISLDNPMDNVCVYFSKYKRRVVLYFQVTLLYGSYGARAAPIFTCGAKCVLI